MIKDPDIYFEKGCGRCKFFDTPQCKIMPWKELLFELRRITREGGLKEEAKWGVPVYTYQGKNIVLISAFKNYVSLNFFKGVFLADPHQILIKPTKNTKADRSLRYTKIEEIKKHKEIILEYIKEAVEIENKGLKVEYDPVESLNIPNEFQVYLDEDAALYEAYNKLTPGRKKGYILHFNGAKQSKTKISRIEKCIPKIMDGIGLNDRY